MKLFQSVLHTSSIDVPDKRYLYLRSSASHDVLLHMMSSCGAEESWYIAWQSILRKRSYHTNNFCEVTVRIFKDHVLS